MDEATGQPAPLSPSNTPDIALQAVKSAFSPIRNSTKCQNCGRSGFINVQKNGGTLAFRCTFTSTSGRTCRGILPKEALISQHSKQEKSQIEMLKEAIRIASKAVKEAAASRPAGGGRGLMSSSPAPSQPSAAPWTGNATLTSRNPPVGAGDRRLSRDPAEVKEIQELEAAPVSRREMAEVIRNLTENLEKTLSNTLSSFAKRCDNRFAKIEKLLCDKQESSKIQEVDLGDGSERMMELLEKQQAYIESLEAKINQMGAEQARPSYAAMAAQGRTKERGRNDRNTISISSNPTKTRTIVPLTEEQARTMAQKARVSVAGSYVPFAKIFVKNYKSGPLGATRRTLRRIGITTSPMGLSFLGRSPILEITVHEDKKEAVIDRLRALEFDVQTDVMPEDVSLLSGARFNGQTDEEKQKEAARLYVHRVKKTLAREVRPSMRGYLVKELYRLNDRPEPRSAVQPAREQPAAGQWRIPAHQRKRAKKAAKRRASRAKPAEAVIIEQAAVVEQAGIVEHNKNAMLLEQVAMCKDLVGGPQENDVGESDIEGIEDCEWTPISELPIGKPGSGTTRSTPAETEDVELLDASWSVHDSRGNPDVASKRICRPESRSSPTKKNDGASPCRQ